MQNFKWLDVVPMIQLKRLYNIGFRTIENRYNFMVMIRNSKGMNEALILKNHCNKFEIIYKNNDRIIDRALISGQGNFNNKLLDLTNSIHKKDRECTCK